MVGGIEVSVPAGQPQCGQVQLVSVRVVLMGDKGWSVPKMDITMRRPGSPVSFGELP